jgi:hypothetical protein
MPNWKKVIVSGSDASLNKLIVSNGITGSFSGSVRAPGSSTQVVFNSGGILGADSGFVYTSGRVGIGESAPSARLEIRGSGATSATTALRVENSGETTSMVVRDDGSVGVGTPTPTYRLTVETSNAVDGIALNGSNNFGFVILESGTVRGYSPAFPTTPGAFSTDSNTRDFVYRVEAATQRFLFNTNGGTGGSTLAITGSRVGINTATPTLGNLTVNGNVWANSYTGSLFGTASWANNAVTASYLLNFPVNPNLYATQNDNLGIVSANTAYSMSFNTLVTSDQLNLVSGSRLEVTSAGKYNIQFSANIKQTSNSLTEVYIWLSRDGTTDLADTNRQITMDGAGNNFTVASWNWVVDAGDNQYYEIRYGASDTNIQLNYQSTPSLGPEIPAAIVSMFKIN